MRTARILLLAAALSGLAAALCLMLGCQAPKASNVQNQHLFVVKIPLTPDVELRPVLANGKLPRSQSFTEMVKRLKPYAAINGTFYGPKMNPLGDIVAQGKLINRGYYPNAVAVKKRGEVVFVRRTGRRFDWRGYESALAAGPRLVHNGRIKLDLRADGFSEMGMKIVAPRSGIGVTRNKELLLVVDTDGVTIPEFAQTMLAQGAIEAMNLDGGPACGLYHDGKTLVDAPLRMTNVLAIYKKR